METIELDVIASIQNVTEFFIEQFNTDASDISNAKSDLQKEIDLVTQAQSDRDAAIQADQADKAQIAQLTASNAQLTASNTDLQSQIATLNSKLQSYSDALLALQKQFPAIKLVPASTPPAPVAPTTPVAPASPTPIVSPDPTATPVS